VSVPEHTPVDARSRLDAMSPQKRALLERMLVERRRAAATRERTAIPKRTGAGPWPLSYAQELMWLLDQLSAGGNAYNSPAATRLEGPLDVEALRRALDFVVERNEILRTRYEAVDGQPSQRVLSSSPMPLPMVDLSGQPRERVHAELDRLLQQEAERPYDLRRDAVLRPTLFRLAEHDHVLLLVVHHIAIDGWSKAVLWRELSTAYDAYLSGGEPQLPAPALQYADWAVWHRRWLDSGVLDRQLAYWRDRLAGVPPLLELPTDRPRPAVRTGRGDRIDRMFDLELLDDLRQLSREEGGTLFMAVLAALAALLGRYADAEDVVVGAPLAGRNRVEIENLVGYFMNTVALRLDLGGDPTFRQLLGRAREASLEAYAHADVPFERVVAETNPRRDLSYTPVFQVMLVLQNQPRDAVAPTGLVATPYRHERSWAKFDLTVGVGERAHGLNTSWEFSTDLFDRTTVERMVDAFGVLVSAAVREPDRPLSELSVVPATEAALLREWEQGGPALGGDRLLPDLVADSERRAPDAPALCDRGREWSYAELVAAADAVAGRLRALAAGPGTPVGVCARSSADLVIALLGVLRAGGICVPLDPGYPEERLRLLLSHSKAAVVISSAAHRPRLPADGPEVLLLDDAAPRPGAPAGARPLAGEPAYVLYTSGSTGRPKGVLLAHAGLVNHALAAAALYGLRPGDRVLQLASPSFDISVEEIFATLAAGACVVARPADLPLGGAEFVDWLERERITVLDLPTAYWHEWVDDLVTRGLTLPSSLRLVVVGGEKASVPVYSRWQRLSGNRVAWINTYGPTEASVVATAHVPPPGWSPAAGAELPIGRPLPGVSVRVLDRHRRRVPPGVRGEIFIGGGGLATGYVGDAQRTAESFLADPDGQEPRLYRTGDLGRWLAEGTLAFAGRRDAQVKIRGHRVEPGEVQAALAALDGVSGAFVVARGGPAARRLVAYAVPRQPPEEDVGRRWRSALAERLPAHLVPDAVVPLAALPLTENGKVDVERLPAHADGPSAAAVPPRDDVERRLLDLWRSLLDRDDIRITDNFFDVGGHSLLAVRLVARLEQTFGARLPLATLLTAPTVGDLAAVLRRERPAPSWDSLVPLQPAGSRPPLFLLHSPNGELLVYRDLVRCLGPDQPVYGLQSVGLDRHQQPLTRIEDMAAHYVRDIRSVQPQGPYLLAGFCYGGVLAVEMAHQLRRDGAEVALVALFDASPYGHGPRRGRLPGRVWRRLGLVAATEPGARLTALGRTVRGVTRRVLRKYRWVLTRRVFLDRGRPLPGMLNDIRFINYMSAPEYRTPHYEGRVTLFVRDDGQGTNVARRTDLWRSVTAELEVRTIAGDGVTHWTLLSEPHVAQLAVRLAETITESLPPARAPGKAPAARGAGSA
jgi:amino acid adenylation domain-containing protein